MNKLVFFAISLSIMVLSNCQSSYNCTHITGFSGVSNMIPFKDFFLASFDNRELSFLNLTAYEHTNGGILLIDPTTQNAYELAITNFPANVTCHPQGIYLLKDHLYVINHGGNYGSARIELFRIIDNNAFGFLNVTEVSLANRFTLSHEYSYLFGDQFMGMLSDVAVIDENQLFFTTFLSEPGTLEAGLLNANLANQTTYLYYCNTYDLSCKRLSQTSGHMLMGLEYDSNKKNLYLSDTFSNTIRIYEVTFYTSGLIHTLHPLATLNLPYSPAFLTYDNSTGLLYAGALQNAGDLQLFATILSTATALPATMTTTSGVLAIDTNNNYALKTLLMQTEFPFTSTGFEKNNNLYFGSFFADGIYICPLAG